MRFTERTITTGQIDRAAGVIHGVKLLGQKSRNGRRYTADAMSEAVPKYNGVKVYIGHPEPGSIGADRKWSDWAGVVENARFQKGAIYGDIRLRKSGPHYEEILEAAEEFDAKFGMSHVADGDASDYRGEEVIESIKEVYSVDIVLDPATTAGLFESQLQEEYGLDTDDTDLSAIVQKLRGAVMKVLEFPEYATHKQVTPQLERLADVIQEMEAVVKLHDGAEQIGMELTAAEIERATPGIHESAYDCIGRPRLTEFSSDDVQRFARHLR